jgi:exopolyphosphatase/guanosine-5'-triphosphate,3'-diphosphate pyrophosphatase
MVGSNTSEIQIRKVSKLRKELEKMTLEEREDVYQLKPDRADVIVPACEIFEFILKELKVKNFFVPKIGLSDGMIYDLYLNHQ